MLYSIAPNTVINDQYIMYEGLLINLLYFKDMNTLKQKQNLEKKQHTLKVQQQVKYNTLVKRYKTQEYESTLVLL